MGTLKPGATYVYERVDNRVYAREMGQSKRELVGWTHTESLAMREWRSQINDVLLMCEQHPEMRDLLDRLFVLYNLRKDHNDAG